MVIAVDAMGGDNAPGEVVKGAVKAVNETPNLEVILVGDKAVIEKELTACSKQKQPKIQIVHTDEFIAMDDHPSEIVRSKRKSSMHIGLKLVKDGKAAGFFTAGNSGAAMAVSMVVLGLLEGVARPAIGTILPSSNERGYFFMLDVGANVDCRPEHLVTFAIMGSAYAKKVLHIDNPTVGLLSNGEEEGKGDMLTKAVYPILKKTDVIKFTGNVEGKALFKGEADVVVCDGFVGNTILKFAEGLSKTLVEIIRDEITKGMYKIAAAMLIKPFRNIKKHFDADEVGGAPFIGLKALVVKAHGSSNAKAFKNAIRQCVVFKQEDIIGKIQNKISE